MANESRMRRSPQQARGQRRVSQILDAAAEVFAESGYEAATTNAIAIRANTSIGSLYQFFPNKQAILTALAARYRVHLDHLLEGIFASETSSLQTILETLIDQIAEYYRANPAFQAMFYAALGSQAMTDVADDMCRLITRRISRRIATAIPTLEPELCEFYSGIIVFMLRSLIPVGASGDKDRELMIRTQLKRMIIAYLHSLRPFRDIQFRLDD